MILRLLRSAVLLAAVLGVAVSPAGAAPAAVTANCTVNPTALSAALASASDGDTIAIQGTCKGTFAVAHSITLSGIGGATLDGQAAGTVLTIDAGQTVTIRNLTITNGSDTVSSPAAGGILNSGTLTFANSAVTNNNAGGTPFVAGGGISNVGALTLSNSSITGNTMSGASFGAAGISNQGGTVSIANSDIRGNNATVLRFHNGVGGIQNGFGGSMTVTNSSIRGNDANASDPFDTAVGGITNLLGSLMLINSSVKDNSAGGMASDAFGGILNSSPGTSLTITNSAISGNTATAPGGPSAFSIATGGIQNAGANLTMTNSTVVGNTALEDNGGFLPPVGGIANVFGGTFALTTTSVRNNVPTNCNFSDQSCA